jgi:CubicO group peptidase (beta-lactamase class C family)
MCHIRGALSTFSERAGATRIIRAPLLSPARMRLPSLITRCRVPNDLAAVTAINEAAEVAPRAVDVADDGVEAIWRAATRLYGSGIHPALQLCVRRHGEVLIDRAIGHASGNGPADRKPPTRSRRRQQRPSTSSASKAVTAMLIHLLVPRQVHLNDPVCEYIPEFATPEKTASPSSTC